MIKEETKVLSSTKHPPLSEKQMHELQENLGLVTGIYREVNSLNVLTMHILSEKFINAWNMIFLLSQILHQTAALCNPKSDE